MKGLYKASRFLIFCYDTKIVYKGTNNIFSPVEIEISLNKSTNPLYSNPTSIPVCNSGNEITKRKKREVICNRSYITTPKETESDFLNHPLSRQQRYGKRH